MLLSLFWGKILLKYFYESLALRPLLRNFARSSMFLWIFLLKSYQFPRSEAFIFQATQNDLLLRYYLIFRNRIFCLPSSCPSLWSSCFYQPPFHSKMIHKLVSILSYLNLFVSSLLLAFESFPATHARTPPNLHNCDILLLRLSWFLF